MDDDRFTPIEISKCKYCGVVISYSKYSDLKWFHGGGMYGYYKCAIDGDTTATPEGKNLNVPNQN